MIFCKDYLFIFKEDLIDPSADLKDFLSQIRPNENFMEKVNNSKIILFVNKEDRSIRVLSSKNLLKIQNSNF